MKKNKNMIATIYDTLHAADLDELEGIYKNWASDYESDVINLAGYVGHLISSELLLNYLRNTESACLLYTSPSPRDRTRSRMPSSA